MADEKPIPEDVLQAIVAKARQIHDATPTDHAGDHPIAPIAIQMWMLEETQRAAAEQHRFSTEAAETQRDHDREMIRQNKLLVYGTYAGVVAAFLGVFVTWHTTQAIRTNTGVVRSEVVGSEEKPLMEVTQPARRECTPEELRADFEDWSKNRNDKQHRSKLDCVRPKLSAEGFNKWKAEAERKANKKTN